MPHTPKASLTATAFYMVLIPVAAVAALSAAAAVGFSVTASSELSAAGVFAGGRSAAELIPRLTLGACIGSAGSFAATREAVDLDA